MIATKERAAEPTAVDPSATSQTSDTRSWLQERISTETAVMLAAVWYVLFLIGSALEPRADEPAPVWAVAGTLIVFALIGAMAVGLLARRRWGGLGGVGAGGVFTALVVACPTSGHHPIGPWWFGQMVSALGLVAASVVALLRPADE